MSADELLWSGHSEAFFEWDAGQLGYLPDDPHFPGNGKGMSAYYHDIGVMPPSREARLAHREIPTDPAILDDPMTEEED